MCSHHRAESQKDGQILQPAGILLRIFLLIHVSATYLYIKQVFEYTTL